MKDLPLVSVCVLAYNSSDSIRETLESIWNQTYKNIELIIGDDCSKDDTIKQCAEWVKKKRDRFSSICLITSEKNKGVCGNLNSCYEKANGKWIKIIAGDDILLENCIEDNVNFAEKDNGVNFVFSRMLHFSEPKFDLKKTFHSSEYYTRLYFSSDEKKRLFLAVRKNPFPAPTFFHRNGIIQEIGGYDTKYRFEDWPMWVKLSEKGYRIDFLDKYTVAYRHHSNSVSSSNIRLFNINLDKDIYKFRKAECFKYYSMREKTLIYIDYKIKLLQHRLRLDVHNTPAKVANLFRMKMISLLGSIFMVDKNIL